MKNFFDQITDGPSLELRLHLFESIKHKLLSIKTPENLVQFIKMFVAMRSTSAYTVQKNLSMSFFPSSSSSLFLKIY